MDSLLTIAAPFKSGPIEESVLITNQSQLLEVFGRPQSNDRHYEDWMVASEFLSYGGALQVVRIDGSGLKNSNAGVSVASSSLKIKNFDDYEANYSSATDFFYGSREPGELNNNLKVCTIDNFADQTIGITTTNPGASGATVGFGVTVQLTSVATPGAGTTTSFTGFLKGIITGVTTDSSSNQKSSIDVKIVSRVSGMATDAGTEYPITYQVGNPGSASHLGVYELRHSVDSYGSSLIRFVHANYRDVSGQNGWQQTTPTFSALHAPNQSAGTSIEYQIWGRCPTGGGSVYVNDAWGHASGGTFLVQEIAP